MKKIVEKAQQGDLEAFGLLVERLQDAVFGIALAVIGSVHDAEDVAQEAFIQAWRDLRDLRDAGKFPAWMCRIARNRCLDFLRRRGKAPVPLDQESDLPARSADQDPAGRLHKVEIGQKVLDAIRLLSEPLRLATTLYYINGYSVEEVADFLQVPVGTVKRRLHSSRGKLKERMLAMVEDELKDTRPGPEFKDRIMRSVSSVEVRPEFSENSGHLLLVAEDGRCTFMFIGKYEESAIWRGLKKKQFARPLTHELMLSALRVFGIVVKEARVVDIRESTFYGELFLERGGETQIIDCRPSDAIALGMLSGAKITVADQVLEKEYPRYEDGSRVQAEDVWDWLKKLDESRQKLRDCASEICDRLTNLSRRGFQNLVTQLGVSTISLAMGFGPPSSAKTVRELLKTAVGEEGVPRTLKISDKGVAKAQQQVKAALDGLAATCDHEDS